MAKNIKIVWAYIKEESDRGNSISEGDVWRRK